MNRKERSANEEEREILKLLDDFLDKRNSKTYLERYQLIKNNNESELKNLIDEIGMLKDEKYDLLNGVVFTCIRYVLDWNPENKETVDENIIKNLQMIVSKHKQTGEYPKSCIDIMKSIADFWYEDGLFNEIQEVEEKRYIYKLIKYDKTLTCKAHLSAAYAFYTVQLKSIDSLNSYIKNLYNSFKPTKDFWKRDTLTLEEMTKLNQEHFKDLIRDTSWILKPYRKEDYLIYISE